jgi:KUP system potassium uptake protein
MAVWFVTLAVVGLIHFVQYPRVLLALSPTYALAYAGHVGPGVTFAVLGSVFLALTGGEALYADMGHFGRSAIRISWFAFVAPALVLVYLRRPCAGRSGVGGKSLFPPVSNLAVGARNPSDDGCDRDC